MTGGKLFQILGPATENDLSPYVDLARGTWSFQVSAVYSGATVASLSTEVSQVRRDLAVRISLVISWPNSKVAKLPKLQVSSSHSFIAPKTWNSLPLEITLSPTLETFNFALP